MREAERLDIGGYARNLPDGSVEVVCQGPDAALATLERLLRLGPSAARIDGVESLQVPLERDVPTAFEIR